MRVYLDTSALVKRYLPERNSEAFETYFSELAPVHISRLTLVELRSTFARKRRQKRLNPEQEAAAMNEVRIDIQNGLLTVAPSTDADFIEEAVPEVIAIKHQTLARISAAARPDAIIGSNTSTISIAELSEPVANPGRFLGVHFSNPSPFIPGVEIIPHAGTSAATIGAVRDLVHAANKQTAVVKDVTGFVLNRLQYALFHEAAQLVEQEIATAEDIDTLVRTTFGFRMPFFGPFAIADMAGLDVYNFCYKSLQTEFPERFATPKVLSDLVDAGKLGTKTGAGFLNVPAERTPELIAYRNKAYVAMQKLIDELGPAPIN